MRFIDSMAVSILLVLALGFSFPSVSFGDIAPDNASDLNLIIEKSKHGSDDEIKKAIKELEVLANNGHGLAQLELGKVYFSGRGDLVTQDHAESLYWFDLASKKKIPEAIYYLGAFYWNGAVVEEDEKKAIDYFKAAADSGLTPAKLALGYIYSTSKKTKHAPTEVFRYLSSAADDGHIGAKLAISFMYIDGVGTTKDFLKGSRLLRQISDAARNEYDVNWRESNAAKFSLQFLNGYTRSPNNEMLLSALSELNEIQILFKSTTAASAKTAAESFLLDRGERNSIVMALSTSGHEWIPMILVGGVMPIAKGGGEENNPPPDRKEGIRNTVTKTGSGVLVSNTGSIITNYHVVSNCSKVLVDGNVANLVASDPNNDLALLSTGLRNSASIIRRQKLRLGEEVVVAGFPLQSVLHNGINITNGVVSSLSGISNDTRLIQVSAPINPGNSGGALLDMSGNLVGLVSSTLKPVSDRSPQNINFAISVHVIDGFLANNDVQTNFVSRPRQGTTEGVAKMATKFTKFISCINQEN